MLGSVRDRFESEALALPSIASTRSWIGWSWPEPPAEIEGADIQVQYVSILLDGAVGGGGLSDRAMGRLIGNLAGVVPEVLHVPNWLELVRNYGTAIGVQARDMNSREDAEAADEQHKAQLAAQQAGVAGKELVMVRRH